MPGHEPFRESGQVDIHLSINQSKCTSLQQRDVGFHFKRRFNSIEIEMLYSFENRWKIVYRLDGDQRE